MVCGVFWRRPNAMRSKNRSREQVIQLRPALAITSAVVWREAGHWR
jgi:hypothetical protein